MATDKYKMIDLFAGIGGIRLGFERGFSATGERNDSAAECVFTSEWDKFAQQTYKANFGDEEIFGDITAADEAVDIPDFDICLAGFPCQAFSAAGKKQGFNDDYKGRCRGTLFLDVVRICEEKKPKVIFCENVKNLYHHDKGHTYTVIKETLESLGYVVYDEILNSADFGVAQHRERIYIVAFREDIAPDDFEFPESAGVPATLRDILDPAPVPAKYYLSDTYLAACRTHKARHAAKGHGFGYVIRDLDGVAGTITCGGSGKEGNLIIDSREHSMVPTTNIKGEINKEDVRRTTPNEWRKMQGFPDDFIVPVSDAQAYKQFGNSVSVPVIEAIAKKIYEVLETADDDTSESDDER